VYPPVVPANLRTWRTKLRHAHVPPAHVREVLRSFEERQRLVDLVKAMTREIERLREDNVRLHAAVNFYREAVRQSISDTIER
jgi:hypothetical protein